MGWATATATILAIVALSGAAVAQPASGAAAAKEAYARAVAAYQDGDYEASLKWLDSAYRSDPQPLYVYNRARTLDALGRVGEAYETFLRVVATPLVPEDLKKLASAQTQRTERLARRAGLRPLPLAPGAVLIVDGQLVSDPRLDLDLAPGKHVACLVSGDGACVSCWQREIPAGIRLAVPFPAAGPRARLTVQKGAAPAKLRVDGADVVARLDRLTEIDLDAGRHELVLGGPAGATRMVAVELVPGEARPLAGAAAITGPAVAPAERGPWPWVTVGVGGAALLTGAALLIASRRVTSRDADAAGVITGATQREHAELWEEGQREELSGVILLSAGGAALVGGLTWALLTPGPAGPRTAVVVGPSGALVEVAF